MHVQGMPAQGMPARCRTILSNSVEVLIPG